jgi:hypothetical protein
LPSHQTFQVAAREQFYLPLTPITLPNNFCAEAQARFNAAVDGDFVVKDNELQPALRKLRAAILSIVPIHSPNHQRLRRGVFYEFSYLSVLVSIIIGLAIAPVTSGTNRRYPDPISAKILVSIFCSARYNRRPPKHVERPQIGKKRDAPKTPR